MFEVDPWVIIANSFDFMHLRYVHGLKFDFDESSIRWDDRAVAYEMTFTMPDGLVAHQRISVSGTNTVSYVTGGDVDSMGLFTSTPVGHGSQSYYVAASPHGPQDEVEERLRLQEHIADELLEGRYAGVGEDALPAGCVRLRGSEHDSLPSLRPVVPDQRSVALVVLIGPERSGSRWRGKEFETPTSGF